MRCISQNCITCMCCDMQRILTNKNTFFYIRVSCNTNHNKKHTFCNVHNTDINTKTLPRKTKAHITTQTQINLKVKGSALIYTCILPRVRKVQAFGFLVADFPYILYTWPLHASEKRPGVVDWAAILWMFVVTSHTSIVGSIVLLQHSTRYSANLNHA